ncbi:uncharacterized protein BO95DRAFT_504127 [Aspergillus brunneoviolaceus CBS 621.78]|uniref:Uncharacterized protein n=1 Tax=Aspergillus brunneoviolaceus CBS 621.78 TaxID=1450534 RepID=A0ACD1FZX6_9EURO|nr:hypothetical protein BO95DRAFT_504127 [Aspergillus brunneoviolaceus CBS 621.78]RAH42551.1 hypothetical protein BO95DRAFT_504127 [Aspergillus brunneoviolaceus CBS 621.78]
MVRKTESPVRPPGSPRPDEAHNQASEYDSTNSKLTPAGRVRGPTDDLRLDLLGFGEQQTWESGHVYFNPQRDGYLRPVDSVLRARSWAELLSLLILHCEPLFLSTSVAPPQDLKSYLMRLRLCFQLIPQRNGMVVFEPCPVPPMLVREEVDWNVIEDEMRDTPVFRLSKIERFRDVERGKVYKVDIRGATFAYKMTYGTESLQREISMLRNMEQCSEEERLLRVPKLEEIIGIGTQYAGILITYIPSPASLADLMTADNDGEVSIAERQKWYD